MFFQSDSGHYLTLKWSFTELDEDSDNNPNTYVTFELMYDTEGPISLGFSHDGSANRTRTTYDGFVGGVRDGEGYVQSYSFDFTTEGQEKKVMDNRVVYQVRKC